MADNAPKQSIYKNISEPDAVVNLDIDNMPKFVKEELAKAALGAGIDILRRPDAQAILDTELEHLQREGSTLLNPRPSKLKEAKA